MAEISKEGFWKTYEKMSQEERKIWLQELQRNLLVDDEKCSCGGTLTTPEKAGIKPQQVFTDQGWAWTGADIKSVCLKCGAHILKEHRSKNQGQTILRKLMDQPEVKNNIDKLGWYR